MSALSKLLPKNNKAYVVPTSTLRPVKPPQPPSGPSLIATSNETPKKGRKKAATPKAPRQKQKRAKMSKAELRRIKQVEAENRAANEYYAKQNRRKHAIISNYVKKAEEAQKSPPIPAGTMNSPNLGEKRDKTKIISFNKYLNSMATGSVERPQSKRPVQIDRIINNYRLLLDPDSMDKALDKLRVQKLFNSVDVEPTDSASMIRAKIKIADDNRAHQLERRLLAKRTG